MPEWRELADRREPVSGGRVRLWFELGNGRLQPCTVQRAMQTAENIARIGETLAAELAPPGPIRVYGDGGKPWPG